MKSAAFDYHRPANCAEAIALLCASQGMSKPVGGTQSLGPMLNLRLAQPDALIDLAAIAELRACRDEGDHISIGACVTHAEIEDGRIVDPSCGMLAHVARGIAYRAVRNRGTVGGSLAHADPAADWINAMPLLGADLLLTGPNGSRKVAAADWTIGAFTTVLAEDELLTAVRLPRRSPQTRWSYYKFNRKTGEFAEAIAGFLVDPADGLCRALIGALDGPPHIVEDATALLAEPAGSVADAVLRDTGLEPGSYEYRIHAVALQRAAAQLKETPEQ